MKQLFLLAFFFFSIFSACSNSQSATPPAGELTEQQDYKEEIPDGPYGDLTVEEFKEKMKNPNVIIIDVRTPEETAEGMIERATELNFYSGAFDKVLEKMDPERTYLIYCRVGNRSARTCEKLSALGFKKLYNLAEGYEGWKAAGN